MKLSVWTIDAIVPFVDHEQTVQKGNLFFDLHFQFRYEIARKSNLEIITVWV